MRVYFQKPNCKVVSEQISNLENLIEIICNNKENEPLFLNVSDIDHSIETIPGAERDFQLKNPVIYYYYCDDSDGKPISNFSRENEGVAYRELTLTDIKDLEYFINQYQAKQYIINIKNLAFVIRKV